MVPSFPAIFSPKLREFDRVVRRIQPVLVAHYGDRLAAVLASEARQEYASLIPDLPDLGGRQPHTQFLTATAWFLAMYRVLQRQGESLEESGRLVYALSAAYLKAYPAFTHRLLGFMSFSPRYLKRLQARAEESQLRRIPGDYVYTFIPGDRLSFDYGVDYTTCAGLEFLRTHTASELAPYLCAVDKLYSDLLGWGLVRTMTLADGAEKCDFRFYKGGSTRIALPAALQDKPKED